MHPITNPTNSKVEYDIDAAKPKSNNTYIYGVNINDPKSIFKFI